MRQQFLLIIFISCLVAAQDKANKELGLQLDNDSFVSTYNDFYYTNGMFVFFNCVSDKSTVEKKIIHGFKIGQEIYNPRNVKSDFTFDHNRPYAGYLFAEYNTTKMYQSDTVLGMSFSIGIVGPDSKAEDFQNMMHSNFGFGEIVGWQYQIRNLLAVQFGLNYSKPVLAKITSDKIDFHLYTQSDIGTAFSGISVGALTRISLLKSLTSMQNSNYYKGLGNAQKELYFFVLPKINLQFYDATIQGSMFNNDSPVTFDLKPFRFKGEAGFKFKYNQYNLSCVFNYTTDEIKNSSATGYHYGSLGFSYVF